MKKISLIIAFILLIISNNNAQENTIEKIIAVVGSNILMQSELETQYIQRVGEGNTEITKCKLFEELLYQKLLLEQAQKDSIEISDTQVESELERRFRFYITQLGSEEKFVQFYGKTIAAFKIELRDKIRDLLLSQTMQGKITNGISVTPSEVKNYYNNINPDSLPLINAEVEIGQIVKKPFISLEAKAEAKKKTEDIRQRILKGEKFSTLAVLYSEDPGSSKNGGEYKNIQRGMFVPEFDAVAFRIKEKEISEVFETLYGYHIMELIERKGEMVDVRHILIAPQVATSDILAAKLFLDSIHNLINKDSISFSDASGKFSDDEESKNNGGIILNPQTGTTKFEMDEIGQLDPNLVFSIDKMKVGELTTALPMTTKDAKQAYRLVYLKSRTEPHRANLKDDYQKIQALVLAEKQQKAVMNWTLKKIPTTYIKIADDYKNCKFDTQWLNVKN